MLKIAFVDLETSHPESFANQLAKIDNVVLSGIYDSGQVRNLKEISTFCSKYNCINYSTLEEVANNADAVMILSKDWDTHVSYAEFFIRRAIPVMIDKPIVGNFKDIELLTKLAESTETVIFGGSGWRYAIKKYRDEFNGIIPDNIFIGSPGPFFYYGIHSAETLVGLLGCGVEWVETLTFNESNAIIRFGHSCGSIGYLNISTPPIFPRSIAYTMDGQPHKIELEISEIHNSICQEFIDAVNNNKIKFSFQEMIEPVKIMIAAKQSFQEKTVVRMKEINQSINFNYNEFE